MNFYYSKADGQVAMRAVGPLDVPQFEELVYTPTAGELSQIQQNYNLYVKNDSLVIIKPDRVSKEEARTALKAKIDAGTVTQADLVTFIKNTLL